MINKTYSTPSLLFVSYHYCCMWIWKGGEEGPASSLGAGRHLLQLYKAGPNFEKVPLVDRLISCFSYFLVLPLCQIGQWCWWRGFSEAESSNLLAIGLCPNSDPHMLITFWQLQPCLFCKVDYGTSFMEKDRHILWLPVLRCTDIKSFISDQVVVCRRGGDNS